MPITVTLHELLNEGPKQRVLIQRAVRRLEDAVNHRDFDERVLDAYYRERRWRSTEGRVEHVSPQGVLTRIRAGRERATPADQEIDLRIHLVNRQRPTMGGTVLGRLPIRTAYWFINRAVASDDVVNPAGHFMHEWLHASGFFHYPNNKARKDVPYQVGDIIRSILQDRFGEKADAELTKLMDSEEEDCGCIDLDQQGASEPNFDPPGPEDVR